MAKTITARIDDATERTLNKLTQKLHKSESQIIRDGINSLAQMELETGKKMKRKFHGLGEFDSGLDDLGTNKMHLRNFGK